jgi:hypothetical protein
MKKRDRIPKSVLKKIWLEGAKIVNGEGHEDRLSNLWKSHPCYAKATKKMAEMIQEYLEAK